jgi:sialic acid synthase SpsE
MGVHIIEKHFTLDNNFKGSDHMCALNPENLKVFMKQCRDIEIALGSNCKVIQNSETACIKKLCKSVVAKCYIPANTIITSDMITTKSPATGILAYYFINVIGKKTKTNIQYDCTLKWSDLY